MSNAGCWKRRRAALVIATSFLSGCATVSSDVDGHGACPPVVDYSREFQARAAEELALLPEGAAIAELLSDYSVMRDQARVCRSRSRPLAANLRQSMPLVLRYNIT
jgi:uncharacterized protein YceK